MAKTVKQKLKNWGYNVIIAIDQLFNALTGGGADETLSSRTYRRAILTQGKPKKRWRVLYRLINGLFFDKNHCKTAYESELSRKQYPQDFA
ncbi:DNA helicase UvrD [Rodentibacter pneumotropicus]|uniref:DNA helicase UvrD n=1 Tax=Rodentibacter pneumotropicus TaxID=758 RepID=A0A4S2QLD0_9PAST|nr:DNA helicase UvrD [Rodentibacter pneumotropicus]THA17374.1 DNA helicase UvrD [Rodentibacter pneumotropicus]